MISYAVHPIICLFIRMYRSPDNEKMVFGNMCVCLSLSFSFYVDALRLAKRIKLSALPALIPTFLKKISYLSSNCPVNRLSVQLNPIFGKVHLINAKLKEC